MLSLPGGRGALSLVAAREEFISAQAVKRGELDGTAEVTVRQVADAYRRDVLSQREREDDAWRIGWVAEVPTVPVFSGQTGVRG